MKQIHEIAEGWLNVIKEKMGILSKAQRAVAKQRLDNCMVCEVRTGGVCDTKKCSHNVETLRVTCGCGCYVRAKVLSNTSECPLGKW